MQATRQHILEILKQHGTATVEDLGKELRLTPVTIRHHLHPITGGRAVSGRRARLALALRRQLGTRSNLRNAVRFRYR